MKTPYRIFRQLAAENTVGRDYAFVWEERPSPVIVLAIHGGGIEPGTDRVARGVAGNDYSFYAFMGLRDEGNQDLHISSHQFDEPTAVRLVQRAEIVLSIHGSRDPEPVVYIGGRHQQLSQSLLDGFNRSPIAADIHPRASFSGQSRYNICNRGQSSRGVQLELSAGLRRKIFSVSPDRSVWETTPLFDLFVTTVRQALAQHGGS
jgi:phage replication-related protein YjqB (UPF0714/DUF867 family)